MKIRAYILCGALSAATWLPAADKSLTEEFQQALFEEEANRDLDAAIAGYEAVVKRLDEQRDLAATAVFRMGESYRKLGNTNEAVRAYERILSEFSDQETLVKLSEQNLSVLRPRPASSDDLPASVASSRGLQLDGLEILREILQGWEPMSQEEISSLAGAYPETGLTAAWERWKKAQIFAKNFEIRPKSFSPLAPGAPTPAEASEIAKKRVQEKRLLALRLLDAQITSARKLSMFSTGNRSRTFNISEDQVMEMKNLELTLASVKSMTRNDSIVAIQSAFPDPALSKFDNMLIEKRAELAGLRAELGPDHPRIRALDETIEDLNDQLDRRLGSILKSAESRLTVLKQIIAQNAAPAPTTTALTPVARAQQGDLLEQEIELVQSQLIQIERRVEVGTAGVTEPLNKQRELVGLRRQVAALDNTPEGRATELQLFDENLELNRQLIAHTQNRVDNGMASPNELVSLNRDRLQLQRSRLLTQQRTIDSSADSTATSMTTEEAEELRRVQALVANSPDLINKPGGSDGLPPLHTAIWNGHLHVVRYLLANGVSTGVTDKSARTPLYLAAYKGQLNALRLLLEAGVDID